MMGLKGRTFTVIGIFGDGIGFEYHHIVSELQPLVTHIGTVLIVAGRSGMDRLIVRYGQEHSTKVMIFPPNTNLLQPERDMMVDNEMLLCCDSIMTFNCEGKENTKLIEQKARDLGIDIMKISLNKKGWTICTMGVENVYRYVSQK